MPAVQRKRYVAEMECVDAFSSDRQSGQKRAGEGDADGETELGFDDPFFQHEVTTATAVSKIQLTHK